MQHQIGGSGFGHRRTITRGCVLSSSRHGTNHKALSSLKDETFEMAARTCRKAHDVEQTQKVIPLNSPETSFGQNVSKLVFGVNIFDTDLGFQFDSVKPIKSNSVSSRHMSHCWTSSFDFQFDHRFIIFKNVQLRLTSLNCSNFCLLLTCWVLVLESRTAQVPWWPVCLG